jgi:hypothetical protein
LKWWRRQKAQFKSDAKRKLVILEIGCGKRIPTVRNASEKKVKSLRMGSARLIRINPDFELADSSHAAVATSIISIKDSALSALQKIDASMTEIISGGYNIVTKHIWVPNLVKHWGLLDGPRIDFCRRPRHRHGAAKIHCGDHARHRHLPGLAVALVMGSSAICGALRDDLAVIILRIQNLSPRSLLCDLRLLGEERDEKAAPNLFRNRSH